MNTFQPNLLNTFLAVVFGGTLLLHTGCGGDDASASAGVTVDSGIAPDRTLVSLTDAEALQLCAATADAADEIYSIELRKELSCTLAGVTLSLVLRPDGTFGVDRALCERARDECLAKAEWSVPDEKPMCELHPKRSTTGEACTASVADYEACVGAALQATADAFEMLTCAAAAAQSMAAPPTASSATANIKVPECAGFEAKCGGRPSLPSM